VRSWADPASFDTRIPVSGPASRLLQLTNRYSSVAAIVVDTLTIEDPTTRGAARGVDFVIAAIFVRVTATPRCGSPTGSLASATILLLSLHRRVRPAGAVLKRAWQLASRTIWSAVGSRWGLIGAAFLGDGFTWIQVGGLGPCHRRCRRGSSLVRRIDVRYGRVRRL